MIKFRIGDKIKVIDDDLSGVVVKVNADEITVENEHGFEEVYSANEILPDIALEEEIETQKEEEKEVVKSQKEVYEEQIKENFTKNADAYRAKLEEKYKVKPKVSKKRKGTFVLDLHYGQLENYSKQLPTQFILKRQVKTAIDGIIKAKEEGYSKIILIHGKGRGVLELEIKKWLDKEGYYHYDADFSRYKLGATEVEL